MLSRTRKALKNEFWSQVSETIDYKNWCHTWLPMRGIPKWEFHGSKKCPILSGWFMWVDIVVDKLFVFELTAEQVNDWEVLVSWKTVCCWSSVGRRLFGQSSRLRVTLLEMSLWTTGVEMEGQPYMSRLLRCGQLLMMALSPLSVTRLHWPMLSVLSSVSVWAILMIPMSEIEHELMLRLWIWGRPWEIYSNPWSVILSQKLTSKTWSATPPSLRYLSPVSETLSQLRRLTSFKEAAIEERCLSPNSVKLEQKLRFIEWSWVRPRLTNLRASSVSFWQSWSPRNFKEGYPLSWLLGFLWEG